jgi:hypothetical protein
VDFVASTTSALMLLRSQQPDPLKVAASQSALALQASRHFALVLTRRSRMLVAVTALRVCHTPQSMPACMQWEVSDIP